MILFIAFIALIFGFVFGITFDNWTTLKPTFFDFKIFDVLNLLSVLILGTIISFSVTKRVNRDDKLRDVVLEHGNEFKKSIENVFDLAEDYLSSSSRNREKMKQIKSTLKTASVSLNNWKRLREKCLKSI